MKKRIYHGWILLEHNHGYKDLFSVQISDPGTGSITHTMGYNAAQVSVDFFEKETTFARMDMSDPGRTIKGLNLGNVKLEPMMPLGFRVYTEVEDEPNRTDGGDGTTRNLGRVQK